MLAHLCKGARFAASIQTKSQTEKYTLSFVKEFQQTIDILAEL